MLRAESRICAASSALAERYGRASEEASGGLQLAERAEQNVGERAVHGAAHDDRENKARRAIQGAGDDQQLVVEHESHGAGRQTCVGIEQRDDRGHVGAADGNDQQYAEYQGQRGEQGKQYGTFRRNDQSQTDARRCGEDSKVDEVLSFISDGPLRQHLLQFSEGHHAGGEGKEAEQRLDNQSGHLYRGERRALVDPFVIFSGSNQRRSQRTASV